MPELSSFRTHPSRYSWPQSALHWLAGGLLVAVFLLAWSHDWVDARATRRALLLWHTWLGLSVLGVALLRVLLRLWLPAPAPMAAPVAQRWLASALHTGLYLVMLSLPVLGLLLLNAKGHELALPGGWTLPAWIPANEDLEERLADLHEAGAWLLLGAVGLHVAAALWHHWVLKDNALARITRALPTVFSPKDPA